MANVIFAEQTLSGFVDGVLDIVPAPFVLTEGKTYRVVWDGVEHECVCAAQTFMEGAPVIMDLVFNESGNPIEGTFAIAYGSPEMTGGESVVGLTAFDLSSEAMLDVVNTEHTLAIYAAEDGSGTEGASIVLKDRNGEDVTYNGIKTVTFDTPEDGKQATFSLGVVAPRVEFPVTFADGDMPITADENTLIKEIVLLKPDTLLPENIRAGVNIAAITGEFIGDTEEATVELSMADGDQTVLPSAEGKVLSKVTIAKPETLLPENIAEGIDIAGIVGTFAGGAEVKIASGSFSGSGSPTTINHGLGVVPDIVFVARTAFPKTTSYRLQYCFCISNAFKELGNIGWNGYKASTALTSKGSSDVYMLTSSVTALDEVGSGDTAGVHSADETSFIIGVSGWYAIPESGITYYWVAIGGLT